MLIRTLAPDTEPKKRRPVDKPGVFIEDYALLFFCNFFAKSGQSVTNGGQSRNRRIRAGHHAAHPRMGFPRQRRQCDPEI